MAELVASAMGIAAFGVLVGDKILKLKTFVDGYRGAPEEMRQLIAEMSLLRGLLSECCEPSVGETDAGMDAVMSECHLYCLEGTEVLDSIVTKMHREILNKKKLGSLKVMWKKGSLDSAKNRLRDAKLLLLLSKQLYDVSLQRRNNEMLLRLLAQHSDAMGNPPLYKELATSKKGGLSSDFSSQSHVIEKGLKYDAASSTLAAIEKDSPYLMYTAETPYRQLTSKSKRILKIHGPAWLSCLNKAIELSLETANYSFGLVFRVHNEVCYSSDVIQYTQDGNVMGLRMLFDTGLASPFDRWQGLSLLEVAALHYQANVCEMLLDRNQYNESGLVECKEKAINHLLVCYPLSDHTDHLRTLDVIARNFGFEDPFPSTFKGRSVPFSYVRGDPKLLNWLLVKSGSTIREESFQTRLDVIANLCNLANQPYRVSFIRILLNSEKILPYMLKRRAWCGANLLNCIAWGFGEHFFAESLASMSPPARLECEHRQNIILQDSIALAKDLVCQAEAQHLHCTTERFGISQTPLGSILHSFAHLSHNMSNESASMAVWAAVDGLTYVKVVCPPLNMITNGVQAWLQVLESCGIDLEEYGRKESSLYANSTISNVMRYGCTLTADVARCKKQKRYYGHRRTLRSSFIFSYGPTAADWQFFYIDQADNSAAEFWEMIEDPKFDIPGAWTDDTDGEDV
ncbi:hypothetical protein VTL71DRAFT_8963 [Oculimacula yallundae]|uniref:Uncharacterized protein n=1 Tax=Oculimacula yallundae TaxID=86028 RepID=A0ABR4BTE4_9HELO